MSRRKPTNLLALAILSLLNEKPMHPYEIGSIMRERKLSDTIKLNTGSLYAVIDALLQGGWIEPVATEREGRHPERTVYAVTEEGKAFFTEWLCSLLRQPAKEYPQFAAALAFLGHLTPNEVKQLLEQRLQKLHDYIAAMQDSMKSLLESGIDRLFLIETEYNIAMGEAERDWIVSVIKEIEEGTFSKLWSSLDR